MLSAVASVTLGVQVALILVRFFAMGVIPINTLDIIVLRSAFHRIFDQKGFRCVSYALSGSAILFAALASYEIITGAEILPELTGPVLAIGIISASFGYGLATWNKRKINEDTVAGV
jgi:nickel/cobalt transporter (NiCoT) family protein